MNLTYLSSAERRARAVLDAYGSYPAYWPADERQAVLECIANSPALQQHQALLTNLDLCIHSEQTEALRQHADVLALHRRILARLPAQSGARDVSASSLWRNMRCWLVTYRFAPVLAALAVFAIVLVMARSQPPAVSPQATAQFEAWSWYDITGQDLPAASPTTALTMTDLIDLEVDEDGG